ncbi:hypothetical protein pb186bvf_006486 [Paramecium bursaria]
MKKLFLLSLLSICIFAHIHLGGHKKQNKQNKGISFHSAAFEMQNIGDQDYKLDPKIASKWDQETKNLNQDENVAKNENESQQTKGSSKKGPSKNKDNTQGKGQK